VCHPEKVTRGDIPVVDSSSSGENPAKSRVPSRRDWLEQALEVLGREGLEGLEVDTLAASLGTARGSFYALFKDRLDFLEQLLRYWQEEFTTRAIRQIRMLKLTPRERLLTLMNVLETDRLGRHEVTLRAWAAHDPMATRVVRKVDDERLTFIEELFAGMGFNSREARMRGQIFYFSQLGEFSSLSPSSRKGRSELLKLRHRFFTRP
jgi:AcrR family transcriptional regulator